MSEHTLSANPRTVTGKKVKFLRASGVVPGTIYTKGESSVSIEFDGKTFVKTLLTAGKSTIIHCSVGKTVYPVLISAIQRDPIRNEVMHVEFHKVNLKEKIKAHVPLEYVGEPIGIKEVGGLLLPLVFDVEVEALPSDLPEKFIVDVTPLATINAELQVKDIPVSAAVTIHADPDLIIVKLAEKVKEEVVEAPVAETPAAEGEAATDAGATPAETPKEA
jgi:large subunit ribosomal protein L25